MCHLLDKADKFDLHSSMSDTGFISPCFQLLCAVCVMCMKLTYNGRGVVFVALVRFITESTHLTCFKIGIGELQLKLTNVLLFRPHR